MTSEASEAWRQGHELEDQPGADPGPEGAARVAHGERRLVVLGREGAWGVRDFGPASEARCAFRGIAGPRSAGRGRSGSAGGRGRFRWWSRGTDRCGRFSAIS